MEVKDRMLLHDETSFAKVVAADGRTVVLYTHTVKPVYAEVVRRKFIDPTAFRFAESERLGRDRPLADIGFEAEGRRDGGNIVEGEQSLKGGLGHRTISPSFEEADCLQFLPARLVPLVRTEVAMVALVEIGVGCNLLVQQAGGVGDSGNQRDVGAGPFNSVNKMPKDVLLKEVADELDGNELLLDNEVALREAADGGAECEPDSLKFPLFTELVECFENVRCNLVDVGVMQQEDIDVVGSQSLQVRLTALRT